MDLHYAPSDIKLNPLINFFLNNASEVQRTMVTKNSLILSGKKWKLICKQYFTSINSIRYATAFGHTTNQTIVHDMHALELIVGFTEMLNIILYKKSYSSKNWNLSRETRMKKNPTMTNYPNQQNLKWTSFIIVPTLRPYL